MPPLLILFFVLTIIFYAAKQIKLRLQLNGIPGPTGYPVVGNTFEVIHGGAEGRYYLISKSKIIC